MVVRNAFNKEVSREIRNTIDRFIGIFVIIALGVGFFSGIGSTGTKMKVVQDEYLDSQNLMDIHVISTYGINDNDVKAIRSVKGVDAVYPAYSIDALVHNKSNSLNLKIHSLDIENDHSNMVNRPYLLTGRMPERSGEALVEASFLTRLGVSLGDTVTLESGKDTDIRNSLTTRRYKVVGTVKSPYYISTERGSGSIGNGRIDCYVYIPQQDFYQDVYSEVFVTVDGTKELMCFNSEYTEAVKVVLDRIKDLEPVRAKERAAEMTQKAYADIAHNEKLLEVKRTESNTQFTHAEAEFAATREELSAYNDQLNDEKGSAESGLRELEAVLDRLGTGLIEIENGIRFVDDQKRALRNELQKLEETERQLRTAGISTHSLNDARNEIERGFIELEISRTELESQQQSVKESIRDATASKTSINEGLRTIELNRSQLIDSRIALEEAERELQELKTTTAEELSQSEKLLNESRKKLNDIDDPEWYVLDRETNAGFLSYREDSDKIHAIGRTFPLFFFLVAALICLTTMSRLVEERRTEIGTLKALGYGDFKILSKYIIYAAIPTVLGGLAGGYVGMVVFPGIILNAYQNLYTISSGGTLIDYALWGVGIFLGAVTTISAAVITCYAELRETPATLLRPKPPKTGKRTIFESITFFWKRLSFTAKVTVRNIVRYKKRFFMTIFGIGGCTGLLLAGFGIKDSISELTTKQFESVFVYDMKVTFANNVKQKDITYVLSNLTADPLVRSSTSVFEKNMDAQKDGGSKEKAAVTIPADSEGFYRFISLQERVSQKPLYLRGDGVILSEKLGKLLGVGRGGTISLTDGDITVEARVSGFCENYFNNYIYMSKEYYKAIFGEEAEYNVIYSSIDDDAAQVDRMNLANKILDKKNVNSVTYKDSMMGPFSNAIDSLNIVVLVIVVSAGALAFVVLFNLTNININERIRELATIEVLGFKDKEVEAYVYRENMILTAVGILLGYVLGYFLHFYITQSVESRLMMFSRTIFFASYFYSAFITAAFAIGVNKLTSTKLKKINMVEALKSME